jgi:quercetin dioxygenase-like cupin family protein
MSDGAVERPYPGVSRVTTDTPNATVNEYTFQPGAQFPLHHHNQAQITVVLAGAVQMEVDGEVRRLSAEQWVYTPGQVPHGIAATNEPARFLAIVVPPRGPGDEPSTQYDPETSHDF